MSNKTNILRFKDQMGLGELGERIADGDVKPGRLVYRAAGKIKVSAIDGTAPNQVLIADDHEYQGDAQVDIDAVYNDTETAFYRDYLAGDRAQVWLAANQTIAVDDFLTPDGNGDFKEAAAAVAAILDTGVIANNNAITFTAQDAGSDGNDIKVALIDPAGNTQPLTVTVYGTYIEILLATDGGGTITSTPATIIPAIAASAAASTLVIGTDTGASTGASVVVTETVANLANGSDADVAVLQADEAVITTGAVARIEATVLV